jgi:aldehyde dehydrogenase (NAD+)
MEPERIVNWIGGRAYEAPTSAGWIEKKNPHTGTVEAVVFASDARDVSVAVETASVAFRTWSSVTPVARGNVLGAFARIMRQHRTRLAEIVARETGKPPQDAQGEVEAAILQSEYFAGEGMRLHGRSLTSGMPGKHSHTVRQPLGVAALIVPANTPIANIAWKTFPALICGNSVVLKAAEDAPAVASAVAALSKEAGLPDGVFNVVHGYGDPAGKSLVQDQRVAIVSFTGSTAAGRWIAQAAGQRLGRVSLELGGKNPFVVCDDADMEAAVHWASLSAFSNAGQRCASGSRILVFESVYDAFVAKLAAKAQALKLGIDQGCELGPVINAKRQAEILSAIERARQSGGRVICGGRAPSIDTLRHGYYVEPTLIDGLPLDADVCVQEIFGPVATVHRVSDVRHALEVANATEYGLTAAIHTKNTDRAMWFAQRVRAGVVNVNIGTFGSEPHMPFGGFGASGNGTREPGVEALDVYSELKNISFLVRESAI